MKLFESNIQKLGEALNDTAILKRYDELVAIEKKEGYKSPKIKLNPEMDTISEFSHSGKDTTYIKNLLRTKRKLTEAVDVSFADKHLAYWEKEIADTYKRQQVVAKNAKTVIAGLKKNYDLKIGMIDFQGHDNRMYILVKFAAVADLHDKFAEQIKNEFKRELVDFDKASDITRLFSKFDVAFSLSAV